MFKKSVTIVIMANILFLGIFELIYINTSDKYMCVRVFSGITILFIFYYLYTWFKKEKNRFMLYPVFLMASYIYHFGQFIVNLFNSKTNLYGNDSTLDLLRFPIDTLHFVQGYAWLCISSLHVGALIALQKFSLNKFILPLKSSTLHKNYPVFIVGSCLTLVTLIPASLVLYNQYIFRSMNKYGEGITQYAQADILATIGAAFWPGLLFTCTAFQNKRWVINLLIVITTIWFIVNLIIGDRSSAIQPIIALIWILSVVLKKTNWKIFGSFMIVFTFVLCPIIALTRTKTSVNNFDLSESLAIISSENNPAILFLAETGLSAIPLADTIEVVPSNRPYNLGSGYIENLFISPLRWFIEPGYIGKYGPPAYWLIKTRYPNRLSKTLFLGFSFIAEAYLEFGVLGFIFTFALGYFLVWMPYFAIKNRSAILIASLSIFLSYLIHYSRGDSSELGRPLFRYVFLPVLVMLLVDSLLKSKSLDNKRGRFMSPNMLLKIDGNLADSSLTNGLVSTSGDSSKSTNYASNNIITERVAD